MFRSFSLYGVNMGSSFLVWPGIKKSRAIKLIEIWERIAELNAKDPPIRVVRMGAKGIYEMTDPIIWNADRQIKLIQSINDYLDWWEKQ